MGRISAIQAAPVERNRVVHAALQLEVVTIVWMVIEAGASVVAGIGARSLLLVAVVHLCLNVVVFMLLI